MAIDNASRWNLIRDVIVECKTGTLVLQSGARYLNWWIEEGKVISVSSTFEDFTFTQLLEKKLTQSTNFPALRNRIDERHAIGSLLLHANELTEEEFCSLLREHWIFCVHSLFEPSAHVFWSGTPAAIKAEFIRTDRAFAEVLLLVSRDSIPVAAAVRLVQQWKGPFRIRGEHPDLRGCNEEERRIWMYLQNGSSLQQMLADRDIARIPCYKFLFLLWLCGYIGDVRPAERPQVAAAKITVRWLERIPPEWVFPLCAGALIGVILAPSSEPKPAPAPVYRVLEEEPTEKPAWQYNAKKQINTETQSHRDDEIE